MNTEPKKVSIIMWAIAGGVIATLSMGFYQAITLHASGELMSVGLGTLALEKMRLHYFAAWGVAIGCVIGIIEKIAISVLRWYRHRPRSTEPIVTGESVDSQLRAIRTRKAQRYLDDKHADQHPSVENTITALNGTLTYKVLAYRVLSEQEAMQVVAQQLKSGQLIEPAPGGVAVVATEIGKPGDRG